MYIDTSAFVKLYVQELDSQACEDIVGDAVLVSSRLLYCEFRSALLRKVSRKALSYEAMNEIWSAFENDINTGTVHFLAVSDVLILNSEELLREVSPYVSLRTLDALHLATYLSAEVGPLLTRDDRMAEAATRLGLPLAS